MSNVKTVSLGSRAIKIAAFSLKQLDEHQATIDMLLQGFSLGNPEHRKALVAIIAEAARSAGDPVTEDELRESLDISNAHDVLVAFFARNGFVSRDAIAPGEATAAASAS